MIRPYGTASYSMGLKEVPRKERWVYETVGAVTCAKHYCEFLVGLVKFDQFPSHFHVWWLVHLLMYQRSTAWWRTDSIFWTLWRAGNWRNRKKSSRNCRKIFLKKNYCQWNGHFLLHQEICSGTSFSFTPLWCPRSKIKHSYSSAPAKGLKVSHREDNISFSFFPLQPSIDYRLYLEGKINSSALQQLFL